MRRFRYPEGGGFNIRHGKVYKVDLKEREKLAASCFTVDYVESLTRSGPYGLMEIK